MNETIPKFELVRKEALEFLKSNTTAVIATTYHGMPDVSTINYAVGEGDFSIYFMTQDNTNKYSNILHNNHVAVLIGTGPQHISLRIYGTTRMLERKEISAEFEKLVSVAYAESPIRTMHKFHNRPIKILKVEPEKVVFMNLDDMHYSGSVSDRFVTVFPYAQQI